MTSISVIIGTFGDTKWQDLALSRAVPSIRAQTKPPASTHLIHASTLSEARNAGAENAKGEWLCFLDADDELDARYLEVMANAIELFNLQGPHLLQPSTLGVVDGREDQFAVLLPEKRLIDGNFMVIGTLIQADQFRWLGGFREFPLYEDWDLWLRSWCDGARFHAVPEAIYRVHVSPSSRNNQPREVQLATYHAIRNQHLPAARKRERVPCRPV